MLSLKAAYCGITLAAAHTVVFAELYWTPGICLQAEDRAHRIGQKNCVNVQYLVGRGTLDEMLWRMIVRKVCGCRSCLSCEGITGQRGLVHEFVYASERGFALRITVSSAPFENCINGMCILKTNILALLWHPNR